MFALKPVWEVYRESNFGIDGNIDFSNFRFSYIKINPDNCDEAIIAAYPAYNLLVPFDTVKCFDYEKDGPFKKDKMNRYFKFKGMDEDIHFIA